MEKTVNTLSIQPNNNVEPRSYTTDTQDAQHTYFNNSAFSTGDQLSLSFIAFLAFQETAFEAAADFILLIIIQDLNFDSKIRNNNLKSIVCCKTFLTV